MYERAGRRIPQNDRRPIRRSYRGTTRGHPDGDRRQEDPGRRIEFFLFNGQETDDPLLLLLAIFPDQSTGIRIGARPLAWLCTGDTNTEIGFIERLNCLSWETLSGIIILMLSLSALE